MLNQFDEKIYPLLSDNPDYACRNKTLRLSAQKNKPIESLPDDSLFRERIEEKDKKIQCKHGLIHENTTYVPEYGRRDNERVQTIERKISWTRWLTWASILLLIDLPLLVKSIEIFLSPYSQCLDYTHTY